ncbi:hypothetical protein IAD21_04621 [Abditibacteriota bacterium]|nr:hypothetical protein IAD21_04621 [Abditibacteriota bacterium]
MPTNDYQNKPCPICGEMTYTWGIMQGYRRLMFGADDESLSERLFATRETVHARHCDTCSNLQLFVDYEPKS